MADIAARGGETANGAQSGRLRDRATTAGVALLEAFAARGTWVAAAGAVWLSLGVWENGPPAGNDTIAHLVRSEHALEHIVGEGRLDGWQPTFGLGYQQFLFIGPLFTWLVGLVRLLGFGELSTLAAFKLAVVASFAALPFAVAFLARSFGLTRQEAGVAALLSLTVSTHFGGAGLEGAFRTGLVLHQLGSVLLCVVVGCVLRTVMEPSDRWIVRTGVATALLVLTHGISTILLALLLPVLLGLAAVDSRLNNDDDGAGPEPQATPRPPPGLHPLLAVGVGLGVGGLLAAVVLAPLAAHTDLRGPTSYFEHRPFTALLAAVLRGRFLLYPGVAVGVVLGWLYWLGARGSGRDRRRPFVLTLAATPLAFLVLGEVLYAMTPDTTLTVQIPTRGLAFAGLVAVIPLAALVVRASQPLGRLGSGVAVLAVAVAALASAAGDRGHARAERPSNTLVEAAQRLRTLVPDGARFALHAVPNPEATGVRVATNWMAWATGRNMLNTFNIESTTAATAGTEADLLVHQPPDLAADLLVRYGVTHVLLLHEEFSVELRTSPRFALVWESGPLSLFAVQAHSGRPPPASLVDMPIPATARLLDVGPHHLRIHVDTDQPTFATVAVAWSPKWRARVNGEPAQLVREPDGIMSLLLPAGTNVVTLDFRNDTWDHLGLTLSVATAAALAYGAIRRRRTRLVTAKPR